MYRNAKYFDTGVARCGTRKVGRGWWWRQGAMHGAKVRGGRKASVCVSARAFVLATFGGTRDLPPTFPGRLILQAVELFS